jgi:hypothetical protein
MSNISDYILFEIYTLFKIYWNCEIPLSHKIIDIKSLNFVNAKDNNNSGSSDEK